MMSWIGMMVCAVALTGEGAPAGLTPPDFYLETTVTETAVSPDGSLVAFTVMTIDEEDNGRHREIWMQQLRKGNPVGRPFRFTSPTEDSASPRWSPDGKLLSFQSSRDADLESTWFLRVTAPGGEAFQLDGVDGAPIWSPNGRWIAYVTKPEDDEDIDESPSDAPPAAPKEREGWVSPDAVTSTLDPKRFDGRVVTQMGYKSDGTLTLLPHPSIAKKSQLFVVSAEGGEPHQVTDLPYNVRDLAWTEDSNTLLFVGDPLEDDEYNTDYTGDLYAVNRRGGVPTKLTEGLGAEWAPAVSPDGSTLAYLHSAERGAQSDVMVADIAFDGTLLSSPRNLTGDWDYSPGAPMWTPSSDGLRWTSWTHGNAHVMEVAAEGGPIRQITRGDRRLDAVSYSEDGSVMAFATTDPLTPEELAVADGSGANEQRVTSFNESWLSERTLMPAERLIWTVADGTEIEGWVIKPVGYTPGESYPMILKIHGGPHSAYGNTWFRTFHVLSAAGFFVLYPNPRGSAGYGHDYMMATRGKWGLLDAEDYLSGVDAALAKYSDIDPERVGVSGGSYGGYMTCWLTATTDRFAAANPSRTIVNWESWYGTSDAQALTDYEFFGAPWEERALYRQLSPLSYVENVTAPTLIIHSENDYRTPIADAEQWYTALKTRKVPVELVRYPRSSHGLSRTGEPWLLVDRLERIRSWFVHWLKPPLTADAEPPTTDATSATP